MNELIFLREKYLKALSYSWLSPEYREHLRTQLRAIDKQLCGEMIWD